MLSVTHLKDVVKQFCHNYCSIGVFADSVTSRDMFVGEDMKDRSSQALNAQANFPQRLLPHTGPHNPSDQAQGGVQQRTAPRWPEHGGLGGRVKRTRHDSLSSSPWIRGSRSTWVDSWLGHQIIRIKLSWGSQHHCALPLRPRCGAPRGGGIQYGYLLLPDARGGSDAPSRQPALECNFIKYKSYTPSCPCPLLLCLPLCVS